MVVLAIVVGSGTSVLMWRRAENHSRLEHSARLEVEQQERASRLAAYDAAMLLVQQLIAEHQIAHAKQLLREQIPSLPTNLGASFDTRDWEWRHLVHVVKQDAHRTLTNFSSAVVKMVLSPDGRQLVTANTGYEIQLWDINSGGLVWQNSRKDLVTQLKYASDGRYLLVATA